MNRQQRRAVQNNRRSGDGQNSQFDTLPQGTTETAGVFVPGVKSTYTQENQSGGYEPISPLGYRAQSRGPGILETIQTVGLKVGVGAFFVGALAALSYIVVIGYGISKAADSIQGDVKDVRSKQERQSDELRGLDSKLIKIEGSVNRLEMNSFAKKEK